MKKINEEVIEKTICAYAKDKTYYLKYLKGYAAELNFKTLNVSKDLSIASDKFLDNFLEKSESIGIKN